jgi:HlyD family secretion protein
VKDGQRVEFTVDAYPDVKFTGKVTQIRLQPLVTSNVVTYTVVIQAPNPDQKLMPGMTANSTIIIAESNNTLLVPGMAMRFTPDKDMLQSYLKNLPDSERPKGMRQDSSMWNGRNRQDTTKSKMSRNNNEKPSTVWVKNGSLIHRKHVKTGISDGSNIEIKTGLNEGDEVVLSMSMIGGNSKKPSLAKSPFMPQRPGRR